MKLLPSLSAGEAAVYRALVSAADAGAVAPSNNDLCEVSGYTSPGKTSAIVSSLEARGG